MADATTGETVSVSEVDTVDPYTSARQAQADAEQQATQEKKMALADPGGEGDTHSSYGRSVQSRAAQVAQEIMEAHKKAEEAKALKESGLDNPLVAKRAKEIEMRTQQDLISPDQTQRWEKKARKGAEHQKKATLARARSLGLNAAQMGALEQGLQEADVQFEKQVYQMREEDRESAKVELEDFLMAARERGTSALLAQEQMQLQRDQAAEQRSSSMWGSVLGFLGTAVGVGASLLLSDERIKSDIDRTKTKNAAYDFLENLDVAQYNMPGANTPEMGVMAQSMEKSPLGQQAVTEVEGVKSVDVPQAFKSLIVAQKEMHDRIKKLEVK